MGMEIKVVAFKNKLKNSQINKNQVYRDKKCKLSLTCELHK